MSLVAFTMLPTLSDKAKALRDTVYTSKEDKWSWSFWKNNEHVISMIIEVDGWFMILEDIQYQQDNDITNTYHHGFTTCC